MDRDSHCMFNNWKTEPPLSGQKIFVSAHKSSFSKCFTIHNIIIHKKIAIQLFYHICWLWSLTFLIWENDLYERSEQVTPHNTNIDIKIPTSWYHFVHV